jgi:serine/threonine protein kinase
MTSPHGGSRLGTRFGPYELNALIGVGGMGEVYRAYDTIKERTVAVKVLRAEMAADPNYQERFRRESRMAARLQEPHVIPVHDFGDIDGVLYIDMRLVEGGSLKDELRTNGAIDPGRASRIVAQVAAALDAAHADGLVHRDIKPENVLLTPDDFAYLVDFGIAHGGGDPSMTTTGLIIGSCAYMSAERFSGGQVGPSADVYSLTCLLYEMLTGRPPFETGDLRQLMTAHMFSPPPRPSIMRRGINRAFDDVIARGMAKKPEDRFATAGELAKAATTAAAGGPVPPAPPLPPAPAAVPPAPAAPPVPSRPASTRQFSAVYANPAGTGYTPYPPPKMPLTEGPPRKSRFGRTQVGLVVATTALFALAVVLATQLFTGNENTAAPTQTTIAVPTPSVETTTEMMEPSATTPSTTPTTTTPTTSGAPLPGVSGTDSLGFVGHAARCDPGSTPAAAIRTAQSLAVICETTSGDYYYHGERLRDGANVRLDNAVPAGGGFDVTNPADGARYEVRPNLLTILSNGHVDSAEPALEYSAG